MTRLVEGGSVLGPNPDIMRVRLGEAEAAQHLAHDFSLISGIIPRFTAYPLFVVADKGIG